jgi:hypothetical protein
MGKPSRVQVAGPLGPYACGFRRELARQGYTSNSASNQLQLMAHASRWLVCHELGVGELTEGRVQEFLVDRRVEGYTLWLSIKAVRSTDSRPTWRRCCDARFGSGGSRWAISLRWLMCRCRCARRWGSHSCISGPSR